MTDKNEFKLANVLLKIEDHLKPFPGMVYRSADPVDFRAADGSMAFGGTVDFLTYFNALSAAKWRRYASLDNAYLHVELEGDACEVEILGVAEGAVKASDAPNVLDVLTESAVRTRVKPRVLATQCFEGASQFTTLEIEAPLDDMLLVGFTLRSKGATAVRNAYWYTLVAPERVRPVHIAIATTTFKNEQYILPNIELIREGILQTEEPVASALHMFVVDNGQTLDAEALSRGGVTVVPNANEGGSAGFARGMMEALLGSQGFTHVLLMDDDVRISPESIIRTFNLLSLVNDQYKDAFINGAMLEMERPNKQFEDVAQVRVGGDYKRIKGELFMDQLQDVAMNEVLSVELPNAYGAWWYACIPLEAVRENGLPLPLFVRCDDVEYGMRCKPTYMTMNGICVWHAAFSQKFRAPVDCYQYVRNYLIMNALHNIANEALFIQRISRMVRLYLRSMAYDTAELMVLGLEDYLKGPAWLAVQSGEAILKANSAAAEKLVPVREAVEQAKKDYPELAEELSWFVPDADAVVDHTRAGTMLRLVRTLPYDRHLLPDAALRNVPATAYYGGWTGYFPEQARTRVLVACDRECKNAHVRVMDRKQWRELRRRWARALADHRKRGASVAAAWKEAQPSLTSVEFWREHLDMPAFVDGE